jgi:hypothetical protein
MEKSNTLNISTIESVIDHTVVYLQTWTKKELMSLMNNSSAAGKIPLVAKLGNRGYLIGNYAVQPIDNNWWQVSYRYNENDVQLFSSRSAAFIYILYRHNNNFNRADRILTEDSDVRRWAVKSEQYYFRYKQAVKKKNSLKSDLFYTRYQETLVRLTQARSLLEKSLKSTKYFKL